MAVKTTNQQKNKGVCKITGCTWVPSVRGLFCWILIWFVVEGLPPRVISMERLMIPIRREGGGCDPTLWVSPKGANLAAFNDRTWRMEGLP